MRRTKVVVLWVSLGPYHISRLRALENLSGFEVTVIELARNETQREWVKPSSVNLSCVTLHNWAYDYSDKRLLAGQVTEILGRIQPDVVVTSGYAEAPMRAAARWARENSRIAILMSESHWYDRPRNYVKEWLKKWWISHHFHAVFVAGERTAAYLEELGFPRYQIWRGYDVVDNHIFTSAAVKARQQAHFLYTKLGLPSQYFLYVGRFAPEKNLLRLLEAYARYRNKIGDSAWGLVMVGGGPQETMLKAKAVELGLEQIVWPGFQQIETLPLYYALASCLVLPSLSEPWGLVINESMACSLPVLVSDRCGAVGDLVFQGLNGYVFCPSDVEGLASLMEWMASGQVDVRSMGEVSKKIVTHYTPENWARALADCIRVTLIRRRQVTS